MSGELGGLLTRRATFLFGIEETPGVDPVLDPNVDAIEVSSPEYTTDPQVLERDYVSNDLSPFESIVGRIVSGFQVTTEVRGNGKQQSGLLVDRPIIADMIQACGYDLLPMTAGPDCHSPVIADADNAKTDPTISWASDPAATSVLQPVLYIIEVTTAGASGAAQITITSNSKADEGDGTNGDVIAAPASETITSGTALTLGAKGGSITPTWTGDLVLGQKWSLVVFPVGVKAVPISRDQKTARMELNRDGVKLIGTRGLGSFSLEANAGDIAKLTFNYTTNFVQPGDELIPDVDYGEVCLPPQVELSTMTWGGNRNLVVEQITYEQANDVQARPSVNGPQGYIGSRIVSRLPVIGFNPEATIEADHPFWDEFVNSKSKVFVTRIGTEPGNQTVFFCGKTQTSEQSFGDRNGTLTYEKTAMPKRIDGDDETIIVFC